MVAKGAIERAAEILRTGGIVAIPTETVYGLAANALDIAAITRVFEAKNRPFFDPLICHFADLASIEDLMSLTAEQAHLLKTFAPGPLTLLTSRPSEIPELVTAGSPWVAVRIPAHPVALDLLKRLDFPLAAPSANPFGYISPTRAEHVRSQLGDRVDYILDGGACAIGIESTVIRLGVGHGEILRPGGVVLEELQMALPDLQWSYATQEKVGAQASPGLLESHYAPRKPLYLVHQAEELSPAAPQEAIFIGLRRMSEHPYARQIILSPSGKLSEAAAKLFEAMHEADDGDYLTIVAEIVPDVGLGRAINDRLKRAALKRS